VIEANAAGDLRARHDAPIANGAVLEFPGDLMCWSDLPFDAKPAGPRVGAPRAGPQVMLAARVDVRLEPLPK
jgi:hypothetical protein